MQMREVVHFDINLERHEAAVAVDEVQVDDVRMLGAEHAGHGAKRSGHVANDDRQSRCAAVRTFAPGQIEPVGVDPAGERVATDDMDLDLLVLATKPDDPVAGDRVAALSEMVGDAGGQSLDRNRGLLRQRPRSDVAARPPAQRQAISIKGLTPGVAYHLAECCHPIPGDRIVGLRREDESIEVHVIGCDMLASGIDADWLDLAWGDESEGGTARLSVILRDVPGALGTMAGILGAKGANIVNLHLAHRDGSFQTFHLNVEVDDLAHLHSLLAALRAADSVSSAERL